MMFFKNVGLCRDDVLDVLNGLNEEIALLQTLCHSSSNQANNEEALDMLKHTHDDIRKMLGTNEAIHDVETKDIPSTPGL